MNTCKILTRGIKYFLSFQQKLIDIFFIWQPQEMTSYYSNRRRKWRKKDDGDNDDVVDDDDDVLEVSSSTKTQKSVSFRDILQFGFSLWRPPLDWLPRKPNLGRKCIFSASVITVRSLFGRCLDYFRRLTLNFTRSSCVYVTPQCYMWCAPSTSRRTGDVTALPCHRPRGGSTWSPDISRWYFTRVNKRGGDGRQ